MSGKTGVVGVRYVHHPQTPDYLDDIVIIPSPKFHSTRNKNGVHPERSPQLNGIQDKSSQNGYSTARRTARPTKPSTDVDGGTLKSTQTADGGHNQKRFLHVKSLSYTVKVRPTTWWKGGLCSNRIEKKVLNNLNFTLKSGEMTAFLGNSGSGKTSLLDVIASKASSNSIVSGSVLLNDQPLTPEMFRKRAGYVIQADRLLPSLTVKETITYVAKLKFTTADEATIEEKVTEALSETGLLSVSSSLVGGAVIRGISGGEKRRLSVAVQLIQDPELLLADEPTTGLDSFTAHAMVELLSDLAKSRNKLVVITVHQPRSDIFKLFDCVGILSLGEMAYLGAREAMIDHFTRLGYPCSVYANPLDRYVDVCSIDYRDEESTLTCRDRIKHLKESYQTSHIFSAISPDGHVGSSVKLEPLASGTAGERMRASLSRTFTLYKRMNLSQWRDKSGFISRIIYFWVFGFLVFLYLTKLKSDLTGVQDRVGAVFEFLSVAPIFGMLCAIAIFPTIRDLYYRELADNLYSTVSFLSAYMLHVLPFHIVSTFIFASFTYWLIGMYPTVERFFVFYAVMTILQFSGELITLLFLSIFQSSALAQSVNTLTLSIAIVIGSGLLRTSSELPTVFQYMQWLLFYKYASEIVVVNEFKDLQLNCEDDLPSPGLCSGNTFLRLIYPDAEDNMQLNAGLLVCFTLALVACNFIVYKITGVKHLH